MTEVREMARALARRGVEVRRRREELREGVRQLRKGDVQRRAVAGIIVKDFECLRSMPVREVLEWPRRAEWPEIRAHLVAGDVDEHALVGELSLEQRLGLSRSLVERARRS